MDSKRKIIGITGNHNASNHEYDEFMQDYTPHGYIQSVQISGNLPVIIPISEDLSLAEMYVSNLDGIIFTGGQDVNPLLYGKEPTPHLQEMYPIRDTWEQALFHAATQKNIPILAVCRGFQLVNILLGGTIYQDIEEYPISGHHAVQHSQTGNRMIYPHHSIVIKPGTISHQLFDSEKIHVNSWHHQVIAELAPTLEATAWAADGVIEAFETNSKSNYQIFGVQWHPELLSAKDLQQRQVFNWFNQF